MTLKSAYGKAGHDHRVDPGRTGLVAAANNLSRYLSKQSTLAFFFSTRGE